MLDHRADRDCHYFAGITVIRAAETKVSGRPFGSSGMAPLAAALVRERA